MKNKFTQVTNHKFYDKHYAVRVRGRTHRFFMRSNGSVYTVSERAPIMMMNMRGDSQVHRSFNNLFDAANHSITFADTVEMIKAYETINPL